MQAREDIVDIEDKIDDCKEEIYKLKYKLRWFNRAIYVSWLSLAIGLIAFILSALNISVLQSILERINTVSITISVIGGVIIGVINTLNYPPTSDR